MSHMQEQTMAACALMAAMAGAAAAIALTTLCKAPA